MSVPKSFYHTGDMTITDANDPGSGNGSVYFTGTSAVFDVEGETSLDKTNIDTTDGNFAITGTNKISAVMTGGSGNIELHASAASFLKSSSGNLELTSTSGVLDMNGSSVTLDSTSTTIGITGATGITLESTANNIVATAAATLDLNATTSILVDSAGLISIDANATSNYTVTGGGDLQLYSVSGRSIMEGGGNVTNAVTITSTNAAGGIDINAGTGGVDILATGGPFSIDGQNNASNISLATNGDAQDFTISLTGTSDSSIIVSSSGTNSDALKLIATAGTSGIDVDCGSGGIAGDTTGGISLDSQSTSNFTLTGSSILTFSNTAGQLVIDSGKASVADSIRINASSVSGGIDIDAGTGGITGDTTAGISLDSATASNFTLTGTDTLTVHNTGGQLLLKSTQSANSSVKIIADNAAGGIDIDSGSGGITIDTTSAISIDASGAASNLSLATTLAAQDLTISVTGATDSSLILASSGTNVNDALQITASAGGIVATSAGKISIQTSDTTNGVIIATTTSGVPITIGSATSLTTIPGSLYVQGGTTTISNESLVIKDNVIVLNAGAGELGLDSGMLLRRWDR